MGAALGDAALVKEEDEVGVADGMGMSMASRYPETLLRRFIERIFQPVQLHSIHGIDTAKDVENAVLRGIALSLDQDVLDDQDGGGRYTSRPKHHSYHPLDYARFHVGKVGFGCEQVLCLHRCHVTLLCNHVTHLLLSIISPKMG